MSARYSVTVTMTPQQAVAADRALHRMAIGTEDARLFTAAQRISNGLIDAGWMPVNEGTEDEPKWAWQKTVPESER